jgi:hypothetical protein
MKEPKLKLQSFREIVPDNKTGIFKTRNVGDKHTVAKIRVVCRIDI